MLAAREHGDDAILAQLVAEATIDNDTAALVLSALGEFVDHLSYVNDLDSSRLLVASQLAVIEQLLKVQAKERGTPAQQLIQDLGEAFALTEDGETEA